MVHIFRRVFTVFVALVHAASVCNVFPTGFRLVSVEHVAPIVPFKPTPDTLREVPHFITGFLVQPVGHWAFKSISVGEDLLREIVL